MSAIPAHAPTVVHMLAEAARREPEREALVCGEERLTYRGYAGAVAAFAAELAARDVAGRTVALVMANSIDHAIAAFAIQAAGAQLAPLNPAYTAHELGDILADAGPALTLHDKALEDLLAPLVPAERRIAIGGERRFAGQPVDLPVPLPIPAHRRCSNTPAARPAARKASSSAMPPSRPMSPSARRRCRRHVRIACW